MFIQATLPGALNYPPMSYAQWTRSPARRVAAVPVVLTPHGRGMGAAPLTFNQRLGQGITGGAAMGTSTAISTGSIIAGSIASGLAVVAPFTGPAAPFLLAAAALVGPLASLFKGCGTSCTQATKYADEAGAAAEQLKSDYWAQPVRYKSTQVQTLAYLDQIAGWLRQGCSDPALGAAGQRCISERLVRGGTAPWCPTPDHKGCDFYTSIYDPIRNDTGTVADPDPVDQAADSLLSTFGVDPSTRVGGMALSDLLLPAALIGVALML